MEKSKLEDYLKQGLSTRKIADLEGIHRNTVSYYIGKYELIDNQRFKKNENYRFEKIDSKEKAYILGFLLGDCHINHLNDVELSLAIADKEVVEFIAEQINSNVLLNRKVNKKKSQFPSANTHKRIKDIQKFTGGRLKPERHYPRVPKHLERYLLQGFFDAEGSITWGRRKDRDRLWHKVSFTSHYKMLEGVQNLLMKLNIPTKVHPKSGEDCFVLEFANKEGITTFLNFIYPNDDFIVLKRKYTKASALRLELGEFGES